MKFVNNFILLMKKISFIQIIISILILINLIILLNYINVRNELKLYQTKKLDCQIYKEALNSNLLSVQMNSNIKIDQDIPIIDIYEKKYTLKELFESGPKLIIYNSETGCNLCIEKELELINNISTDIDIKNIIIISNFKNSRKLKVFKSFYNIKFDVFSCNSLKLPFEKLNSKPCVFVMDSELIVKDFFVPNRALTELSENYYFTIYNKYFHQSNINAKVQHLFKDN